MVITGSGFLQGATVTLGGTPATGIVVDSFTQITCVTPAHAAGPVDVVVTNLDTSSGTLHNGFLYVGPTWADTPLTNISSPSIDTDLQSGTKLIQQSTSPGDAFREILTALAPIPFFTFPPIGDLNGGYFVIVVGVNFVEGCTVTFGGSSAPVTYINAFFLQCLVPAHAVGTVDVVVTNPDTQSGTLVDGFTYNPPAITLTGSVSPNIGPTAGGTTVVITGANFPSDTQVVMGGLSATTAVTNSNVIQATTPAHTKGLVDVEVVG